MFLKQLVNGVAVGSIYALIALGYTMVYGILKIINFAHGDIYMMGTFIGLTLIKVFHLGFSVSFLVSMVLTALLGVLVERIAYRPLRSSDRWAPLLSALGVSILLANLAQLIWGTQTLPFPAGLKVSTYSTAGLTISTLQLYILAISFLIMVGLYLFVQKTDIGVAMRATSHNIQVAQLMGIDTNRIISLTFAIGSALAAAAGILVGIYYDAVYPTMGYTAGLKAFTAAIMGGIGSIPGAMIGGLVLGIGENFGAAYLSDSYRDAIAFGLLVLVLLTRPSGLFGRHVQQKV